MSNFVPLPRRAVVRIVLDMLAEELGRSRGSSAAVLGGRAGWGEETRLDGAGLDLDSLERMDASSALSEFFHLHEYGAEDYLLALPTVGEWCDLVEQSLPHTGGLLTFRTSGSTGEPKRCTHRIADLRAEAADWARRLVPSASIVALVPSHHIYGAIFTALLPEALGEDCAIVAKLRDAPPGALAVGTPTHWAHLARATLAFPDGLTGVTSTAPMPQHLAQRLRAQRLERLVEIYGSSETGGVAWRDHEGAAFTLLDRWTREAASALPDRVRWLDERRFVLDGRRDGAVQIGGVNVFPARVRDALLQHAGVADAAVRLEAETGRLKAFVVPVADVEADRLLPELDRWCGTRLSSAERPRRLAAGGTLPRNAMGKLTDW